MFQKEERAKVIEYLHNTKQNLLDMKKDAEKGRKIYASLKKLGEKGCREKESYNKILKKIHKSGKFIVMKLQ